MTREQMLDRAVREMTDDFDRNFISEVCQAGFIFWHPVFDGIRARFTQIAAIESMKEKAA